MSGEFKGFALLFMTVVMIGTVYIFFTGDDKNAYSDHLYTKEVHNESWQSNSIRTPRKVLMILRKKK